MSDLKNFSCEMQAVIHAAVQDAVDFVTEMSNDNFENFEDYASSVNIECVFNQSIQMLAVHLDPATGDIDRVSNAMKNALKEVITKRVHLAFDEHGE